MLAYVFRHWPRLIVHPQQYEEALCAFQRAMVERRIDGLLRSATFRLHRAPWLPAGRTGYEDWYLLQDSSRIDLLNEVAVTAACQQPHALVAAMAQSGIGSLYRLASGNFDPDSLPDIRQGVWFSKPRGEAYDAFYRRVASWGQPSGAGLFRRQMVLGPPPEFGLLGAELAPVPAAAGPVAVTLERVWPRDGT